MKFNVKLCRNEFYVCERFRCIPLTIFKKPTISDKIVSFLKFVGKKQQLVWKRLEYF